MSWFGFITCGFMLCCLETKTPSPDCSGNPFLFLGDSPSAALMVSKTKKIAAESGK